MKLDHFLGLVCTLTNCKPKIELKGPGGLSN